MGFWKKLCDGFTREYEMTHPVSEYELRRRQRKEERAREREELREKKELVWQRQYTYLRLPERWKCYRRNYKLLKRLVYKRMGENLDDYLGPYFDSDADKIKLGPKNSIVVAIRRSPTRHHLAGCYQTAPRSDCDYDQETAEAHEKDIDTICAAIRVGRVLRSVNAAEDRAARSR